MTRTNAIIETLKNYPATSAELPYKKGYNTMNLTSQHCLRKIRVIGSSNSKHKYGYFFTIYYLDGDEDRAVEHFVKVNFARLQKLEGFNNTVLSRQIEKTMLKKIWKAYALQNAQH